MPLARPDAEDGTGYCWMDRLFLDRLLLDEPATFGPATVGWTGYFWTGCCWMDRLLAAPTRALPFKTAILSVQSHLLPLTRMSRSRICISASPVRPCASGRCRVGWQCLAVGLAVGLYLLRRQVSVLCDAALGQHPIVYEVLAWQSSLS